MFALSLVLQDVYAGDGKLQIGVKKRVENCEQRSKKGDKLHMHYAVRIPFKNRIKYHLLELVHRVPWKTEPNSIAVFRATNRLCSL